MSVIVRQYENGRTMLLDGDGQPMLVELKLREARSAPSRLKAALVIDNDDGEVLALPFAQATMCGCSDNEPHGWTPEWRMEQN
jgi:hypothetical protein